MSAIRITVDRVPDDDVFGTRVVAFAEAEAIDAEAIVGDYDVGAVETRNPFTEARAWSSKGMIARHDRRQNVWRLVERVAAWAAAEAEKQ